MSTFVSWFVDKDHSSVIPVVVVAVIPVVVVAVNRSTVKHIADAGCSSCGQSPKM